MCFPWLQYIFSNMSTQLLSIYVHIAPSHTHTFIDTLKKNFVRIKLNYEIVFLTVRIYNNFPSYNSFASAQIAPPMHNQLLILRFILKCTCNTRLIVRLA